MEDQQKRKRIDDSYYRQIFYMETQEDQNDPKQFEFFLGHLFENKKMLLKQRQKVLAYRFAYRVVGSDLKKNFWLSSTLHVQWDSANHKEMSSIPKLSFSWDAKKQELTMNNMQIGNQSLVPQEQLHAFVISMGMWIGCRPQTSGWDDQQQRFFRDKDTGERFRYANQMIVWSKKHDRQFREDMAREILFYVHCFVSMFHEDLVFFISDAGKFEKTETYFINSCMTCGITNAPQHETNNRARVFCGKPCQILYYK